LAEENLVTDDDQSKAIDLLLTHPLSPSSCPL
jgi:hypothetical protein